MRLNTDFVRRKETVRFRDKSGGKDHVYYRLASSLDNFVLSGNAERAFYDIAYNPKNHLLILSINNISSQNVEERLHRYKLTVRGLIVPEENIRDFQDVAMKLPEVYKSYFRPSLLSYGQSFAVRSRKHLRDGARTNYVISPRHLEFRSILSELGAPEDLILDQ